LYKIFFVQLWLFWFLAFKFIYHGACPSSFFFRDRILFVVSLFALLFVFEIFKHSPEGPFYLNFLYGKVVLWTMHETTELFLSTFLLMREHIKEREKASFVIIVCSFKAFFFSFMEYINFLFHVILQTKTLAILSFSFSFWSTDCYLIDHLLIRFQDFMALISLYSIVIDLLLLSDSRVCRILNR